MHHQSIHKQHPSGINQTNPAKIKSKKKNSCLLISLLCLLVLMAVANNSLLCKYISSFSVDDFFDQTSIIGSSLLANAIVKNEYYNYNRHSAYYGDALYYYEEEEDDGYQYLGTDDKEINDDNDINNAIDNTETKNDTRPKLIMHIGPLKTGTTTLQHAIYNLEYKNLLPEKDNYQILILPFRKNSEHKQWCLYRQKPAYCNSYRNLVHQEIDKLINATDTTNQTDGIRMLYSNEEWSIIPRTEFAIKNMKDLFSMFNVHFIIYYRPFIDWLPSIHKQFKKFSLLDRNYNFEENYGEPFRGRSYMKSVPSFPEYLNMTRTFLMKEQQQSTDEMVDFSYKDLFLDIIHVNEMLRDFLRDVNKDRNPDENIHIMQAYTSSDTNTKIELFCNLLGAKESCKHAKADTENEIEINQSDFYSKFLDLDILVREARKQGLIHVPRHEATELLQRRIEESEDLQLSDFPMHCPSKEQEEWIWNRTVVSEVMFGKTRGTVNGDQDSERKLIIENLRGQFEDALREKKFCSMDAVRALENAKIRGLFHNCSFHSANKIDDDLKELVDVNPLWEELKCTVPPSLK